MLLISMHTQNLVKLHPVVLKILSGNEILTSIKGHNSVINVRKLTRNNPNIDLVKMHNQIMSKSINSFYRHWAETKFRKTSWTIKGQNSVTTWWKLTPNNPNRDLVNMNENANFGRVPSVRSQDIERKRSRNHGMTETRTTWKQYIPAPAPPHMSYAVCIKILQKCYIQDHVHVPSTTEDLTTSAKYTDGGSPH